MPRRLEIWFCSLFPIIYSYIRFNLECPKSHVTSVSFEGPQYQKPDVAPSSNEKLSLGAELAEQDIIFAKATIAVIRS